MNFDAWMKKELALVYAGRNTIFKDVYDGMVMAWDEAVMRAMEVCREKVERDAEYQGRFGGYGNFMGDRTGPECANEITQLLSDDAKAKMGDPPHSQVPSDG